MNGMRRLFGQPVLHFALIGAALYLVESRVIGASRAAPAPVVITAEAVAELEQSHLRAVGRPPTPEERERLIALRVDDELLLREAIALGWHRTDPIVQRRLLQNQRFLDAEPEPSDAELLARAYDQGMDRADIVVRRRLIERMRLAIGATARAREPDEAQLEDYLREHAEVFAEPERVRVTQVYLSRDRRGDALDSDAQALADELRENEIPPDAVDGYGDPILIPRHLPLWSEQSIAGRLGPAFARAVVAAEVGRWTGPLPSAYGAHVVWVHERVPASVPSLARVRGRVRAAWLEAQEKRAVGDALAQLRQGVEVRVLR